MSAATTGLGLDAITVQFGGLRVLRELSVEFGHAPISSLIGPNGAGKTTVFNFLSGIVRPSSGRVVLDGQDVTGRPAHQLARMGIVRKFQVPTVFAGLTIRNNLRAALQAPRYSSPQVASNPWSLDDVADLLGMRDQLSSTAADLSHGGLQWLEIGMAFLARPRYLLLDEPAAGLGPEESGHTADLIQRISEFCRVIVIEHDMTFVRQLGGDVTVLHQGALLRRGTMDEIQADHVVRDVYLGRDADAPS
jgi:urea transport system ATP-binding protein